MDENELKAKIEAAEKRGYSRGYAAGRKRGQLDRAREDRQAEERAFTERAFLAALPAAMSKHWHVGDKVTTESIVHAAWNFARESLRQRFRGRV